MNQAEDFLQDIIEQLEAGAAVETAVDGLTQEESEIVELIAAMRTLPFPEEDEATVVAHETAVLNQFHAQQAKPISSKPASAGLFASFLAWFNSLPMQNELRSGLALAALLLLFFAAWSVFRNNTSVENTPVVTENEAAPASVADGATPEAEDDPDADTAVTSDDTADDSRIIVAPELPDGLKLFLPVAGFPVELTAETAVVDEISGIVEIQGADGQWTRLNHTSTVAVGQRVRTGNLSQTTLKFYDGSTAVLSANTEISIDQLNALRPEQGFRTVVMTQWVGDSEHNVEFRNDGGSRYEVKTPSGSGIARGTTFNVLVTADGLSRYTVTEGLVDVSGAAQTVSVSAGQLSTILSDSEPDEPSFTIFGEGEVEATGDVWTVAGASFATHAHTITMGNPQVGDLVSIEGHLAADGGRVADRIILIRRALVDQFTISGEVEAIADTVWTVAGQTVMVDGETAVSATLTLGDIAHVEGIILSDGTLLARHIVLIEDTVRLPFAFSGVVEAIMTDSWIISGRSVVVDGSTAISAAASVGDVVKVRGIIVGGATWRAESITLDDAALPTFEFIGEVQSLAPWRVGSVPFEVRAWTIIAPGLAVGDTVRVVGTILPDGTRVASSITRLADPTAQTIVFTGVVTSVNPWIVGGVGLVTLPETAVLGNITVGATVTVTARLQADGTWAIVTVWLNYPNFGYGCLTLSTPVLAVDASTITVAHWDVKIQKNGRIKIKGDPKVGSIVTLPICTGWDRTIIIIRDVIVIYQPIVIIIDDGGGVPDGCKISKNGKIKCSNKGSKGSKGS